MLCGTLAELLFERVFCHDMKNGDDDLHKRYEYLLDTR